MQAVQLRDREQLEIVERERPSVAADEVLVAVEHVGICGSDLHYYQHMKNGDNVVERPLVLGHEAGGRIEETGADVSDLVVGDRVAIEPGNPCGGCHFCESGRYNLCSSMTFMGSPPNDGALVEYVSWPASLVYRLPESVSTLEGALCEPLSVGIHACRRADIGAGDSVLVTGSGPIGLVMLEVARARGADPIVVSDVVPAKLTVAERRGATRTVDPRESEVSEVVRELTGGLGVDVAIECSGAPAAIESLPAAVRSGGTLLHVGFPVGEAMVPPVLTLLDRELDVRGSFRYRDTYDRAIELLESETVDVDGMVTGRFPLTEVSEGFDGALESAAIKCVVDL